MIGEVGAVVGTSWGDDSSSKDDASKGGGVVVEPRSKIPQQPGNQASREIWACRVNQAKNPAWPQKARWPKKRKYQLGNLQ